MLPQLPMGTIVTVCMLVGLLLAFPYALSSKLKPLPAALAVPLGSLVFLGGAWNTLWHGLRNMTNFWGVAALISGIFMMLAALYIMRYKSLPVALQKIRIAVLLGLLFWFALYAIKIISL